MKDYVEWICKLKRRRCYEIVTNHSKNLRATLFQGAEQADGTPFTKHGAEQMKHLGICTIVLPLVAAILVAIVRELFGLLQNAGADWGNLSSLTMGIVLILASLIFRYGAELEEKNTLRNVDWEYQVLCLYWFYMQYRHNKSIHAVRPANDYGGNGAGDALQMGRNTNECERT